MRWLSGIQLAPAVLAVSVLALAACGGGENGEAAPSQAPGVVRAVAVRQVEDGLTLQSTVVEVEFEDPVQVGKRDAPTISYFDLDTPSGTALDGTETLAASAVSVDEEMVSVTFDRPIAMDATLFIEGGFFGNNDIPTLEVPVASTLDTFQATLAGNALAPTAPEVVSAGDPPPVTDADRDVASMRQAMLDHLALRGSTPGILDRAAFNYDSIPPDVVPSPKLRAAIAALTGSFAELAIPYLFTDSSCTGRPVARMAFEEIPDGGTLLARVVFDDNGDRVIVLHPDLEGERFEHLMPLVAHEAIHCDLEDTAEEEIAAAALDTLLYAQLLTVDPSLAVAQTPLSRNLNFDVIAMINSGRRYPESLGILASDGITQVLPGSNATSRSYAEQVAGSYDLASSDNPRPEILADVYVSVLAESSGFEAGQAFDLAYLDQLIGQQMSTAELARLVVVLTLQP